MCLPINLNERAYLSFFVAIVDGLPLSRWSLALGPSVFGQPKLVESFE